MRNSLVYDLPTRLFHWLFAVLFLTSFTIANTVDDDSVLFYYHMLAGILLGGLVLFRILWGIVGTKHARFSDFSLNPLELKNYLLGVLTGSKKKWAGHNPASSWAALTMMALALGLAVTGYFMTGGGNKELFEDAHELLSNAFIAVVVLHVAGVVLHTFKHHDAVGLSMVDGKKQDVAKAEQISSQRSAVGIVALGLFVVFALHLYQNFDQQTGTLKVFGTTLQLADNEGPHGDSENDDGD